MTERATQRTHSIGRGGGVKGILGTTKGVRGPAFWAWMVSISVHLIMLSAFGVVRLSGAEAQDENPLAPTARIERIRDLAQATPLTAKPRIRRPPVITARARYAGTLDASMPVGRVLDTAGPIFEDWPDARDSGGQSLPSSADLSGRIEFFGSLSNERKVCYLVDCSGSMQGVFSLVRSRLKESIAALQPDQYFCVIFFGGGKLLELGDGRLVRATPKAKAAADSFIDTIRPAGRTNAAAALEKVVRIRDGKGLSPSLVYFLTDGFELTDESSAAFPQRIANLLEQFAPAMKINTIGFLPQGDDRRMLETIARQSGGEFVCIAGGK